MFVTYTYDVGFLTKPTSNVLPTLRTRATRLFNDLATLLSVSNFNGDNPLSDTSNIVPSKTIFYQSSEVPINNLVNTQVLSPSGADIGVARLSSYDDYKFTSFLQSTKDSNGAITYNTSGTTTGTDWKISTFLSFADNLGSSSTTSYLYLEVFPYEVTSGFAFDITVALCATNSEVVDTNTTHASRGYKFRLFNYSGTFQPLSLSYTISLSNTHMYMSCLQNSISDISGSPRNVDHYTDSVMLVRYEPSASWSSVVNFSKWIFLNLTTNKNTLDNPTGQSLSIYNYSTLATETVSTSPDLCKFRLLSSSVSFNTSSTPSFSNRISSATGYNRAHMISLNIRSISNKCPLVGRISANSEIYLVQGNGLSFHDEVTALDKNDRVVIFKLYPIRDYVDSVLVDSSTLSDLKIAVPVR